MSSSSMESLSRTPQRGLKRESSTADQYRITCNTYVLLLELNWIDMDKRTFSVWCEIGFMYDCYEYLRAFDYLIQPSDCLKKCPMRKNDLNRLESITMEANRKERLKWITPDQMAIQFDVCNAITMDQRTETHFIRKHTGTPEKFYSAGDNCPRSRARKWGGKEFLSDDEDLVSVISLDDCPPNTYWKHETRTYIMELSLKTNQHIAPFDELYLFLKLINCNCQPGSCHVYFKYMNAESDISGMQKAVGGYLPVKNKRGLVAPVINTNIKMDIDGQQWDRLNISVRFRKDYRQDILQYYIVPFLMFLYIPIRNFGSPDDLLGVSSTLVIANVALLIVTQHKVFSFAEMAVLIQIISLLLATIILAVNEENFTEDSIMSTTQKTLIILNIIIFALTTGGQFFYARSKNMAVCKAVESGDYEALQTV